MTERDKLNWFVAGYCAAIILGWVMDWVIILANDLLSEDATGVVVSSNGAATTPHDETVAAESVALISEYTQEDKSSE